MTVPDHKAIAQNTRITVRCALSIVCTLLLQTALGSWAIATWKADIEHKIERASWSGPKMTQYGYAAESLNKDWRAPDVAEIQRQFTEANQF